MLLSAGLAAVAAVAIGTVVMILTVSQRTDHPIGLGLASGLSRSPVCSLLALKPICQLWAAFRPTATAVEPATMRCAALKAIESIKMLKKDTQDSNEL